MADQVFRVTFTHGNGDRTEVLIQCDSFSCDESVIKRAQAAIWDALHGNGRDADPMLKSVNAEHYCINGGWDGVSVDRLDLVKKPEVEAFDHEMGAF